MMSCFSMLFVKKVSTLHSVENKSTFQLSNPFIFFSLNNDRI